MAATIAQTEANKVPFVDTTLHQCEVKWQGNTLEYDHFSYVHQIIFPGGQSVLGNIHKQEPGALNTNPEELFAAAVGTCMMMTMLAVCSKSKINVVAYHDHPEATLEFVERRFRVTKVTLRPQITIDGQIEPERLKSLFEKAHANCFVSLSIKSKVVIEPSYLSA